MSKPTSKKSPRKPNRNRLVVSITLLPATIERLDSLAKSETRSRGNMLEVLIDRVFAQHHPQQ